MSSGIFATPGSASASASASGGKVYGYNNVSNAPVVVAYPTPIGARSPSTTPAPAISLSVHR